MPQTTIKVGDKVRITHTNMYPRVKIGDIATVTSIDEDPDGDNGYMLRKGPATLREHDSNSTGFHFFFYEGQFELVKENYNLNQRAMSDEELIARLQNSKGWPTLGNAAADRIEALSISNATLIAERDETMQLLKTLSNMNGDLSRDLYKTKLLLAIVGGCSRDALSGLVNRMGDKARAALAEIKSHSDEFATQKGESQ